MLKADLLKYYLMWLSGLLSADGTVAQNSHKTGLFFSIASSERDWVDRICRRLAEMRIETAITKYKPVRGRLSYRIYLSNPRRIVLLLTKYECQKFFNPHKWKLIERYASRYNTSVRRGHFTEWEDAIIKKYSGLPNEKIVQLLKHEMGSFSDRNPRGIYDRKRALKIVE
jgi:hypothetical protein